MILRRLFFCAFLVSVNAVFCRDVATPPPARAGTLSQTSEAALPPVTKGQRIFAAHHSYLKETSPILMEMAAAGGFPDQVIVGDTYIGGSKSLRLWMVKEEENKAKQSLQEGAVDVLILTPIYLPDAGIEDFARFACEHNPKVRVTVQEFWLPFDQYEPHFYDPPKIPTPATVDHNALTIAALRAMHARYFNEMDAQVRDINTRLGKQVIFVVPMGQAVIALREKIVAGQAPGLKAQADLFRDKLGHPTPPLQTLIAYAHYAVIYRKSPVGLPVPAALASLKLPADQLAALNHLLQDLAWDAVIHHPLSGVKS